MLSVRVPSRSNTNAAYVIVVSLSCPAHDLPDPPALPAPTRSAAPVFHPVPGVKVPDGAPGHDRRGFRNATALRRADVVVLGDSQTWGVDATLEEAWPQQLVRLTGHSVYNFRQGCGRRHLPRQRSLRQLSGRVPAGSLGRFALAMILRLWGHWLQRHSAIGRLLERAGRLGTDVWHLAGAAWARTHPDQRQRLRVALADRTDHRLPSSPQRTSWTSASGRACGLSTWAFDAMLREAAVEGLLCNGFEPTDAARRCGSTAAPLHLAGVGPPTWRSCSNE